MSDLRVNAETVIATAALVEDASQTLQVISALEERYRSWLRQRI
jgi:hypothetical protein